MTRIIARLLTGRNAIAAGTIAVVVVLVLSACDGQTPTTQRAVAAQGRPASSVPAVRASTATAGTVDKTTSKFGPAPDQTLPKACLLRVAYVESLFRVGGLSFKVNNRYKLCQYSNDSVSNFGVVTSQATDFGAANLPAVTIPQGAPFEAAYVWQTSNSVQAAAHLAGVRSVWVILAVSNPAMTTDELRQAVKAGIQNIMYWWPKPHSPAPSASPVAPPNNSEPAASVPSSPACRALAADSLNGILGEKVVSFGQQTDSDGTTWCLLTGADSRAAIGLEPASSDARKSFDLLVSMGTIKPVNGFPKVYAADGGYDARNQRGSVVIVALGREGLSEPGKVIGSSDAAIQAANAFANS